MVSKRDVHRQPKKHIYQPYFFGPFLFKKIFRPKGLEFKLTLV